MRLLFRVAGWLLFVGLLFLACTLLANLYVIQRTNSSMYHSLESTPTKSVALVLGASVRSNGDLSPVLRERADMAVALYKKHAVAKILVSGDNSSVAHNEVYPVGKYLLGQGIPTGDVFLDYAGFDTYSSMYRAKNIFGVTSMVVVSQRFHLPRALFVSHMLGIDAVGLDSGNQGENYFTNALREIPATVKALYDLAVHRQPRFLGPQFFVTGDGSATWVGPKAEMIYWSHE